MLAIILTCACVSHHGCVPGVLESVISVCARRGCVNVRRPAELLQKCRVVDVQSRVHRSGAVRARDGSAASCCVVRVIGGGGVRGARSA